ncbi:hypothetical protein BsWGS_08113 [Bradybaena similaris]
MSEEDESESVQNYTEGQTTLSTVTNPEEGSLDANEIEEALSLTELLPAELSQIKEFEEIVQMIQEPKDDRLRLYDVPEVSNLFEQALSSVQRQFSPQTVVMELHNVYQVLALSRSNENSLKDRLAKKEEELSRLYYKMRRDPRVYRAIVLASNWRNEKEIEAQACKEYEAAVDIMKADIKDLEVKIHNLQAQNTRLYNYLQKIPTLEETVRGLEEIMLRKENALTILYGELEKYKRKAGEDLEAADQTYAKAAADADKMQSPEEIEKVFKKKISELKAEHNEQINELATVLQRTQYAEASASHNFKNIAKSLRSLKEQLRKLESNLEDSNRKNAQLVNARKQSETTIDELEYQIRMMKLKNEDLQQMLAATQRNNDKLKAELGTMANVSKASSAHAKLMTAFRSKEYEISDCRKNTRKLEDELKYYNLQLGESRRLHDNNQRDLNNTKQMMVVSQRNLSEAVRYNDVLFKRLEWTEEYLKYYQRKFSACTGDNIDMLNAIRHLESLCRDNEATVRIKDAKNNSLVLGLSTLEELLKESRFNNHTLRQAHLMAQTNHMRQMELNDMMTQLLKFTEAEKIAAVYECNKNSDTVMLLQKQLVQRMNKIASQYRDICDLKTTIEKHLQMVDVQKNETNAVRDLLEAVRKDEISHKNKLKALTQERDAFGALVIQKNIIVQLLEKKITLLKKLMERGTTHYRRLKDDIRVLKLEIKNVRHKLKAGESTVETNADLRQELVCTFRQLQLEQHKRKALEELKAPKPHRYVELKCRDPSQYEQVMKVQKLQKLLIAKCQDAIRRENIIASKDTQIQQMRLLLMRRTGANIHDQLREARATLSQKNKQIKGLLSELNVLTFDVNESKSKLTKVLGDLKTAKEEIAKHKRHMLKDTCQHASKAEDWTEKPAMPNDGFSVALYRSHFKMKPRCNAQQHQQQRRTKKQMQPKNTISGTTGERISKSLDIQTGGL